MFQGSANNPILIRGIDKEKHDKGDYVIKLKSIERMTDPAASMRELLAAFIAMEMEIPSIKPAIVEVSSEFVQTISPGYIKQAASSSIGYNFGSTYERNYQVVGVEPLSDKLLPFAQDIFAFDLFIQNTDRNRTKPNMLTNGEEILILDHEIAFGFTFAPFLPAKLWEMQVRDKNWIENHILYPLIKGKEFDYAEFSAKMVNLNNDFWNKAWDLLPDEWRVEQFGTIKQTINSFIENQDTFINELKFTMS